MRTLRQHIAASCGVHHAALQPHRRVLSSCCAGWGRLGKYYSSVLNVGGPISKRRPCNQDCYLGWGSCLPLLNFLLVVKADGLGISLVSKVTGSLAILYLGKEVVGQPCTAIK